MNIISPVHNFFHALKPSFKISIFSILSLVSPIFLLFPLLRSKNLVQNILYIVIALFISLVLYTLGIIFNRTLDLEDNQKVKQELEESQRTIQKLQDNIKSLKDKQKSKDNELPKCDNQQTVSFNASEKIINGLAVSSKPNSTITETITHIRTITINNNTSEELPKDNKTKLNEKGVKIND